MRKIFSSILLALILLPGFFFIRTTSAQEEEPGIQLSLSRDFGYSSGTGKIQGTFSMKVRQPDGLVRVVFMIDGETINEDNESPFQYQFITDNYTPVEHTLSAIGYTADGNEIPSNQIKVLFVTAEEGGQAALGIIIPLLAVVLGLMVFSHLLPMVFNRGKQKTVPLGQPRKYGLAGGTICPKCSRPFAMNFLAPNLLVGKLDRCPHCGKWSVVRSYPPDMLRTAETSELAQARTGEENLIEISEEEKTQKALDDSRYQDL